MFHKVQIRSSDSPRELINLGFKLHRKHGELLFFQPCSAHRDSQCAIYAQRPERCQLFKCRQILKVASGEITEAEAMEKIQAAMAQAARLNELLNQAGKTDPKRPLTKRYEKITAEPVGPFSDPATVQLRQQLEAAMEELEELLENEFRPQSNRRPAPGAHHKSTPFTHGN
jgi:Fe-S-cluster containining protein